MTKKILSDVSAPASNQTAVTTEAQAKANAHGLRLIRNAEPSQPATSQPKSHLAAFFTAYADKIDQEVTHILGL